MKKYILLPIIALFLVSSTALAKPAATDPFQPFWDAITSLQQQIGDIKLLPGPKWDRIGTS